MLFFGFFEHFVINNHTIIPILLDVTIAANFREQNNFREFRLQFQHKLTLHLAIYFANNSSGVYDFERVHFVFECLLLKFVFR